MIDFKHAFKQCYGLNETVVQLGRLPHWVGLSERFTVYGQHIDEKKAYIPAGYFYSVYTPCPTVEEIKQSKVLAESSGADVVIFPCIRQSDRQDDFLASLGGRKIEAPPELVFEIDGRSVEDILTQRISRSRYRDMNRLTRMAEEAYILNEYNSQSPDMDKAIEESAVLHTQHAKKYNNPTAIFNDDALKGMVACDGVSELGLFVRRDKEAGVPVQSMVVFFRPWEKTMIYLAQAINHDQVPPNHNLYRASFLEIFRLAKSRGYEQINLGRGNEKIKVKDLGASQVIPQNHWLWSL